MTSDDDYDFTSTGGNYYQPSRWKAPQPLELPAVDWQSRWREERDRAEKAEAERDAYRARCMSERVCMTCVLGAPEHYGCTDCMNTGYEGGEHPSYCEGYNSGWIAGRDAAITAYDQGDEHTSWDVFGAAIDAIRALTPQEDK